MVRDSQATGSIGHGESAHYLEGSRVQDGQAIDTLLSHVQPPVIGTDDDAVGTAANRHLGDDLAQG